MLAFREIIWQYGSIGDVALAAQLGPRLFFGKKSARVVTWAQKLSVSFFETGDSARWLRKWSGRMRISFPVLFAILHSPAGDLFSWPYGPEPRGYCYRLIVVRTFVGITIKIRKLD